jgi:hypothetical protein
MCPCYVVQAGSTGAGGGFMRAPKRGGGQGEELTEMEKRALANPIKPSKAKALALGLEKPARPLTGGPRGNVRKVRPTMGAGAKRPRR